MDIISSAKDNIVNKIVPFVRFYVRFMPFVFGKGFLLERFSWRNYPYVARTKRGALMAGRSNDLVQGYIYYFGVWEPNLSAFIESRLREKSNRTFVDIGANVGYFTLLAARRLNEGAVVAIEAFPEIYKKLERNVALNKLNNVRLVQCAAADVKRDIEMFYAGVGNEGATTSVVGKFKSEPIVIRGEPLSNLLTENEISTARLIKIDVEGAEYSVVQGMMNIINILSDDAEIVVEITPSAYGEGQLQEIFDIFSSAGFSPYKLENIYMRSFYLKPFKAIRPSRLQSIPTEQTDVVFSKVNAEYL